MGTIVERAGKNGTTGYHAQIVVKRDGKVHRETRTFDRRAAAAAWIRKRETDLDAPGAHDQAKVEDPTLGAAIDRYVAESRKSIGRTKAQVLQAIKGYPLAALPCSAVTRAEITAFITELGKGRDPSTVGNYLSHLSAVMTSARRGWGWPLDPEALKDAAFVARRMGLVGKSKRRKRLPTLDELDRLMTHFGAVRSRRPSSLPMQRIVAFALYSTRRQEEIVRITWADLDWPRSRVLVRT